MRVREVIPLQALQVAEDGGGLLERDRVFLQIATGLACVPDEHIIVYTLISRSGQAACYTTLRADADSVAINLAGEYQ